MMGEWVVVRVFTELVNSGRCVKWNFSERAFQRRPRPSSGALAHDKHEVCLAQQLVAVGVCVRTPSVGRGGSGKGRD